MNGFAAQAKGVLDLARQTLAAWQRHRADRLGAACAFYTVFALGPLLLLFVGVLSLVFGPQAAEGVLLEQFRGSLGSSITTLLNAILVQN